MWILRWTLQVCCVWGWHCFQTKGFVLRGWKWVYWPVVDRSWPSSVTFVYICCTDPAPESTASTLTRRKARRNLCYDETFIGMNRMLFTFFQRASGPSTQLSEESPGRTADPTTPLLHFRIACCPGTVRKRSNRIHFQLWSGMELEKTWLGRLPVPASKACSWTLQTLRSFFFFLYLIFPKGLRIRVRMDQASGGEDPNKPSKKRSSEDEGRNKKLVGVRAGFSVLGEQGCRNLPLSVIPQVGLAQFLSPQKLPPVHLLKL